MVVSISMASWKRTCLEIHGSFSAKRADTNRHMGTLTASGTSHGPAAPNEDLHHLILRVLGNVLDRVHQGLRPHVPVVHRDLDFVLTHSVGT